VEVGVGDVVVLRAHRRDVLLVAGGWCGQDGQVGIDQCAAPGIRVGRAVRLGEPHQPDHLTHQGRVEAEQPQLAHGPLGGAFLGPRPGVVDTVVEPRRHQHRGPVERDAGGGELVDPPEDLGQVTHVVVAARGPGVRLDEPVPDVETHR